MIKAMIDGTFAQNLSISNLVIVPNGNPSDLYIELNAHNTKFIKKPIYKITWEDASLDEVSEVVNRIMEPTKTVKAVEDYKNKRKMKY